MLELMKPNSHLLNMVSRIVAQRHGAEKRSFVPSDATAGAGAPPPPGGGGGAPPDPSGGGAPPPMDPSMMPPGGGMPPGMDPAAMGMPPGGGMPPPDPSGGGMPTTTPQDPTAGGGDMATLVSQAVQQTLQQLGMGGSGGGGAGGGKGGQSKPDLNAMASDIYQTKHLLLHMYKAQNMEIPHSAMDHPNHPMAHTDPEKIGSYRLYHERVQAVADVLTLYAGLLKASADRAVIQRDYDPLAVAVGNDGFEVKQADAYATGEFSPREAIETHNRLSALRKMRNLQRRG